MRLLSVQRIKEVVSKELCCVGGRVEYLVSYQHEVDKGKFIAVVSFEKLTFRL